MENKEKRLSNYRVTVVIRPKGYTKMILEGEFITKYGKCSPSKIKKQVWDYLKKSCAFAEAGIDVNTVDKTISAKIISNDFVVCEDK